MKRILSSCLVCFIALSSVAFGATGRVGVQQKTTSRMPTMSIQSIGVTKVVSDVKDAPSASDVVPDDTPVEPVIDMREKEREACISNNIGIGNTFVWASRYSDINNYATMVEDVEHPENNTCFVLVGVRSTDSRIDLSDISPRYFEMGQNIACGSWINEDDIEKRILDAKKRNRTLATIGGAVGGAAIGVGSMELFGNRLIGGKVQGQKDENVQAEVLCRQMLAIKTSEDESDKEAYDAIYADLESLKRVCGDDTRAECTEFAGVLEMLEKENCEPEIVIEE